MSTKKPDAILFLAAVVLALAAVGPARATDVCGEVCDETWTSAGSPYEVTCDAHGPQTRPSTNS